MALCGATNGAAKCGKSPHADDVQHYDFTTDTAWLLMVMRPPAPATYPASFGEVVETIEQIPAPTGDQLACDWGNAQACADDNAQRASFAGLAVKAHNARCNPSGGEPPETVVSDLLGDLMHLCDALDLDFDAMVEQGRTHYEAELAGIF